MNATDKRWYQRGGIRFLLIVLLLYAIAWFVDAEKMRGSANFSISLLFQMLPVLLLVFVLMFVTNLLVKPNWVRAHMGRESGLKGWFIAIAAGIISMGPIYPWYALLKELKANGMRPALIVVFLYNRGIKLPLLPLLVHYFGLAYTVLLTVYMVLFSLVGGLLLEKLLSEEMACVEQDDPPQQ